MAVTTVPPGGIGTFVLALDEEGKDPLLCPPNIVGAVVTLDRSGTFDVPLDNDGEDPV